MEALDVPCLTFVFAIACDAAGRGTYVADTDVRPLPPTPAELHTRSLRTDMQHGQRRSAS